MNTFPNQRDNPPFIVLVFGGLLFMFIICVGGSLVMRAFGLLPTNPPTAIPSAILPPPPSDTPQLPATLLPTAIPLPTSTPTPFAQPILLAGSGDSVVDVQKWEGPAILKITHIGGGNFALWNDDVNGDHIELLVNETGAYQGTLPLDFLGAEHTAGFEVRARGAWELQILPFEMMEVFAVPGVYEGIGSNVLLLDPGVFSPDQLIVDASEASSKFSVYTYGNVRDLVIDELAPYTGTVALDRETLAVSITATGPWRIEITIR